MKYNKTAKRQMNNRSNSAPRNGAAKKNDAVRKNAPEQRPSNKTPVRPPSGKQIGYAITLPIGKTVEPNAAPQNISQKQRKKNKKLNKKAAQQINSRPQSQREQSRQENAKRHRRRGKRNYTLHYTFLAILGIVTLVVMSYTVFFNIDKITITQGTGLDTQKMIDVTGAKIGDNLLRMNTKKMEEKIIKSTIFLDSVEVRRKLPKTLDIKLTLSKASSGVNYGRRYYFFSKVGRCIEISDTNTHPEVTTFWGVDLEKIKLGEYLVPNEKNQLDLANSTIDAIKASGLTDVQAVDLRDLANIKIYYKEQIEIKIGNTSDLDYKLKLAKEIIDEKITDGEIGILDVRIIGKGYFKAEEAVKHPS